VSTLVLGSPPPELKALLERRSRAGVDRLGEVWEGVHHVEIVSPNDETWQKVPFYAAHGVDEVLIVDPTDRTVAWLGLRDGEYRAPDRSGLVGLGPSDVAGRLDWP
jgi:hypothetical protein